MECAIFSSVVKFFEEHQTGTFQDISRYVQESCQCGNAADHVEAALDNGMELGIIEPIGRGSVKPNNKDFQFFEFRRCKSKPVPNKRKTTIQNRVSFSQRSSRLRRTRRRRSSRRSKRGRRKRSHHTRLSHRRKLRGRKRSRSRMKRPVNRWCLRFDGIRQLASTLKTNVDVDICCQSPFRRVDQNLSGSTNEQTK